MKPEILVEAMDPAERGEFLALLISAIGPKFVLEHIQALVTRDEKYTDADIRDLAEFFRAIADQLDASATACVAYPKGTC